MAKRHAVASEQKSPGEMLRHPLRVRILAACTERETAIRQFAEQAKVPLSKAEYHFHKLEKEGYIRIGRKEPVRGVHRHLYVATRLGVITDAEFAALTDEDQRRLSNAVVTSFHGRCWAALQADTFDSRDDSHFTWVPRVLDEQGWKDQMNVLFRGYERSNEIEAESKARLRRSGKEGISTTVALAGFESPPDNP
jgi:hypothetical protein